MQCRGSLRLTRVLTGEYLSERHLQLTRHLTSDMQRLRQNTMDNIWSWSLYIYSILVELLDHSWSELNLKDSVLLRMKW